MRVDARQLHTFVTVADAGSLVAAAGRLHVTQPALSMQLRALQETLGLTLFARTGRGLRLTAEGEQLLPLARHAIDAVGTFERAAGGLDARVSGEVAIGTVLDPDFIRLGDFLGALMRAAPGLQTELRHGISGWVLREVRERRLDVGFFLGDTKTDVARRSLASVRYLVIAPRGWQRRVAGRDWSQLAHLPWVWTRPESAHHRMLAPIFRAAHARPNVAALVDQESSMLDLVRAGVGLSLARESVALREAHQSGLVVLRERAVETELAIIALAERAHEAPIAAALDAASTVWSGFARAAVDDGARAGGR